MYRKHPGVVHTNGTVSWLSEPHAISMALLATLREEIVWLEELVGNVEPIRPPGWGYSIERHGIPMAS